VRLRSTREADLDVVLQLERDDENNPYVGQWSRQEHRAVVMFDETGGLHVTLVNGDTFEFGFPSKLVRVIEWPENAPLPEWPE
jgi:hypothetical protein